jgi:nicotinate phosphoribosyltransferase
MNIDSKEKMLIYSDGLDLETIVKLYKLYCMDFKLSFGWGTNLTNDCGIKPLNIVVKLSEINGRPTVKLSDVPGKAMGPAEEIERYRRVFV